MCGWVLMLALLLVFFPVAGMVAGALIAAYFLYSILQSFCAVEVHASDLAAWVLYHKQKGKTPGLPEKLRGVFWMSTNAAPELLCTLEGQSFNPETRTINLDAGGHYSWSHSTGLAGWAYWWQLRVGYMFCAEMHVKFDDDDYTHAELPLYLWGCCKDGRSCDGCWCPGQGTGQWWTMEQVDENTWERNIFFYCMPWKRWEFGSYLLRRIIDGDGNQLPAFDDMMDSIHSGEKIKGVHAKPLMQIMNGDDWKGHFLFGEEGNPSSPSEDQPSSEQNLLQGP